MAETKQVTLKRFNGTDQDTLHPETHWDQVGGKPSTFTPTAHSLNSHTDVNASPTDGQALVWDGTNSLWIAGDGGSGAASVTISETEPSSPEIGDLWWDSTEGNLYIYYDDGSSTQWVQASSGVSAVVNKSDLQSLYIYGKASATITKGQAIQFAGTQGDHILIKPAVQSEINANPTYMIGIADSDLAANDFGYVIINGRLILNTSTYTAGTILYYDSAGSTAGALTTTEPTGGTAIIEMAAVSVSGVDNGEFVVRTQLISREIHEVIGLQTALDGKANTSHTHTKSQITDFAHTHTKSEITDFAHTHAISDVTGLQSALDAKATPSDITTAINNLINLAPSTLDTLDELAAALGDDANFASTVTTSLAGKVDKTGVQALHATDALRVSGTTVSLYKGDGTFESITTQDTNTTYSAGSGLSLSGTTFSNTAPDQTVSLTGSGATTVTGTYPNFTISSTDTNTNTTYSAGSGLSLSGTTFSHADTSTQASVNNAGRTYIQDITLDTYGHITGITSATETVVDTNTTYTAGGGLTLSGTQFSHTDTSAQGSVNNSGATVIQDVTLDTYGHTTGLASVTITPALIGAQVAGSYAPASHTHDDRYYTESEADSRFINTAGDTLTGTLNYRMLSAQQTSNLDTAGDNSGFSVFYGTSSATGKPSGTDHSVLTLSFSNAWQTQLAGDWRTKELYYRTQENGTWKSWSRIWHDGNFNPASYLTTSGKAADSNLLDGIDSSGFLRVSANSSSPLNGNFAIGSASSRNFIQSHNSQPLDINPLGNAVTVNNQSVVLGNDSRLTDARTPTAHTHDDRYYTESEVNTLLAGKLGTTAKAADSNLLDGIDSSGFASAVHTHQIDTTVTIGSLDHLAIIDNSDANRLTSSSITFGTSASQFLANNGTWQSAHWRWEQLRGRADNATLTSSGTSGSLGGSLNTLATLAQGDTIMMEVNDNSSVSTGYTPNVVIFTLGAADTIPTAINQAINWRTAYANSTLHYHYSFKVGYSGTILYFDDAFKHDMLDSSTASSIITTATYTLHIGRIWRLVA